MAEPIRFEADSNERTRIDPELAGDVRDAGRLEVGPLREQHFLNHADGCSICGQRVRPGAAFYFDPDTGEVLCERHGEERLSYSERDSED